MKVSKNSWHYRFTEAYGPSPIATNLCPYVRNLIITAFLMVVVTAIGSGFVICALDLVGTLICRVIFGVWFSFLFSNLEVFTFTYIVGGFISLMIAGSEGPRWLKKKVERTENHTVTLMKGYYDAKHDKICPQLEFEDQLKWRT